MREEISREEIAALLARESEEMTREEAIEELSILLNKYQDGHFGDAIDMAMTALEQEQKTGHWIETAEEYYKAVNEYGGGVNEDTPYFTEDIACSECLSMFSVIDNETERFDCCPHCGAKNVEPQESEVSE